MRFEPNIGLMMKLQNRKAILQSLPAFLIDQTCVFIMIWCWSLSYCHLRFGFFFASFASLSLWSKWKVARVFGAFDRFATALHWDRPIQLQRRGVTKVSSWNEASDEFQTFVWGGQIFLIYCWDKPPDLCLYYKPNLLRNNNVFFCWRQVHWKLLFLFPWVGHVSSLGHKREKILIFLDQSGLPFGLRRWAHGVWPIGLKLYPWLSRSPGRTWRHAAICSLDTVE